MEHNNKSTPLPPGEYWATCRERTLMQALDKGHIPVFPQARCTSDGQRVVFYRNGVEVWSCSAAHAAGTFEIQPA
ncbi:MAG: hypothetical protein ACREYA_33480 [Cupriavidus necator]